MKKVNWGIIGCGDVTEIKSGPAFSKVANSSLVAVMRRDAAKTADYAKRHNVPRWYSNADELIADPEVNAIYIATPPDSHEAYAIAAINAGKPVYVEKPMALNYAAAKNISRAAAEKNVPLVVAHYRRQQPLFKKVKALIKEKIIGDCLLTRLEFSATPLTPQQLAITHHAWRVDPAISGGGLFHDLAPHQLDLMHYFFGEIITASGIATNQHSIYSADDLVMGNILFEGNIGFTGSWSFNAAIPADCCEIIGTKGTISFSIFTNNGITIRWPDGNSQTLVFESLPHMQQPMIEKVVQYFLQDDLTNPCSGDEGVLIMRLLETFSGKKW